MSWRTIQLGDSNCDQDEIILNLYKDISVKYIGYDQEFAQRLILDEQSEHAVAIYNQPGYLSDFITFVSQLKTYKTFYLGINRYLLLGNDTTLTYDSVNKTDSENLILTVKKVLPNCNIVQSGSLDNDRGRYFNFVQPLTWVYATN